MQVAQGFQQSNRLPSGTLPPSICVRAEPSVDSFFFMARLVRYLSSPPAAYHWWPCAAAHATLQGRPASYSVMAPQ